MTFLKDRGRAVLREHFRNLDEPVRLIVLTDKEDCPYFEQTAQLVREVAELSGQIDVDMLDWRAESQRAADYGVDKAPAIVVLAGAGESRDTRMRFFGIPSGYEFGTLIDDVVAASRNEPKLAPDTRDWLATLTHPLHLQVFVTPACPYCPRAVNLAHRVVGLALIAYGLLGLGGTTGVIVAIVGVVPLAMGLWGHCLLELVAHPTHGSV